MIIAGVDEKNNCNDSIYVVQKIFKMVTEVVAEAQGNLDDGKKYSVRCRQKRRIIFTTSRRSQAYNYVEGITSNIG